jgi:glycosyltransferase involved in cell wall biosynthesis
VRSAIRKFARRHDVLVFAAMPFASVNWARHAAGSSARIYHLPFRHANDPYYHWPSYTETLRAAHGILLLSSRELDGLPEDVRAKGHVISGGVDLPSPPPEWLSDDERAKLKDELGIASHSTMVLFVGRKSPSKGYLELNEGIRLANQRLGWVEAAPGEASIPPPFVLVLAGPDEDGIQLRDRHVMLAGVVSESTRDKLYRAADLFGFLSQSESFGLVMLEAWAAGCVVLAGRRSAQATEVAAALGAPTTAPEAQSVAEALLAWRSTPTAVRRRRWEAGYAALRTQFTWWATAERFERAVE